MNNISIDQNKELIGRILSVSKNSFTIGYEDEEIPGKLKGNFYWEDSEQLPVVGDYVKFIYNPLGESMILSVCERKNLLQRFHQKIARKTIKRFRNSTKNR